jgi:hypothetical protein
MKLDRRFTKQAKGKLEGFNFDVGVLNSKPHRTPRPLSAGLKSFPGGVARKMGKNSGQTISQVAQRLRKKLNINYLTRPFKMKTNKDILLFTKNFFNYALGNGRMTERRLLNTLQAIVRNPILRGDYGKNSRQTAKIKGFNKLMVDTGQLFKNITARVFKRGNSV